MFENKSKTEKAVMVAKGVAAFCVGTVINRIIEANVTVDEDSRFDKTKVKIGGYVLSGIIVDQASSYAAKQVTDVTTAWAEQKAKQEAKTPTVVPPFQVDDTSTH